MGISLHSHNHQGAGLKAMIAWVNEQGRFDRFRIGLSDTLNRHNYVMEDGLSYAKAHEKAARAGEAWLDENSVTLSNLQMPFELVRWDHWLDNHAAEVEEYRNAFYHAFQTNDVLKAALTEDVSKYFQRRHGLELAAADPDKVSLSLEYLIEELAVYSAIFKDYPSTALYPGKQLKCFEVLRDGLVSDVPPYIQQSKFIRLALHHQSAPAQETSFALPYAGLKPHVA